MQDLSGKVAFITGGGSGVALGQAKVFAEEAQMKVVIADVQRRHLDEALSYFKGKNVAVHAIQLDITDRHAYARAADEAERVFGPYSYCAIPQASASSVRSSKPVTMTGIGRSTSI